jgi:hypothetical protein
MIDRLIGEYQSAFRKKRYILNSMLCAHEIICGVMKEGILLKLDFEKAYDKMWWDFLANILEGRGFPKK